MYSLREIAPPAPAVTTPVGEKVWLLNLDQIEPHTGALLSKEYVEHSGLGTSTHAFDDGNVLYSKLRPYLNKVLLPDIAGYCTSELVPMRPNQAVVTREYLAAYLRSPSFLNWVSQQVDGAKMPRVSMKVLWEHHIELPTLHEQKRITAILDKADSLRRKRKHTIRLADEFLRAVFIDMFGDPETNPKSFAKGTIRDLVSSANYGTSEKASDQMGHYPILRMNNITYAGGWNFSSMKYVDLDEASAHKYLTQKGDLLFNRTNSKELVGKTAVYMRDEPMAIAGYLVRVRMNERGNAHYVSGYLNSAHGKHTLEARAKSIVGMANINAQEMQDIPLLLPPIELQDKFASIVGAMQERLRKHHAFSCEVEALHAALSEKFFSQTGERVPELC